MNTAAMRSMGERDFEAQGYMVVLSESMGMNGQLGSQPVPSDAADLAAECSRPRRANRTQKGGSERKVPPEKSFAVAETKNRRFAVALSFPGEWRAFVDTLAAELAAHFGEKRILYDKYHEAEFAAPNLDVALPGLYRTEAELVVVLLYPEYTSKRWCGLEFRHIRQLLATADENRIMFIRDGAFGDLSPLGIVNGDGMMEVGGRSPREIADKILERHHLTEPDALVRRGPVARTRTYGLPRRLPEFIGRNEDLVKLESAFVREGTTISLALSGLVGVGKTALAVEIGHRLANEAKFPAGICWLQGDRQDLAPTWASDAIGGQIAFGAEPGQRVAATIHKLSTDRRDLLIILDNVVSWNADSRPSPLPQGSHVHILVTTTDRNLGGAQFTHLEIGLLPRADARRLLTSIAGRDVTPGVDPLLDYLDGHTLAIEMAASYLAEFVETTAEQYLAEVRRSDYPESSLPTDRTASERTTFQAMQTLWSRLDTETQLAWCLASVFADAPATFELSNVCGLTEASRRRLRRFHLANVDAESKTWQVHNLIRNFGRTNVPKSLLDAAQHLFLNGCLRYAEGFDPATCYNRYIRAHMHLDRASRMLDENSVLRPEDAELLRHQIAMGMMSAGMFAQSRAILEQVLDAECRRHGEDHENVAATRSNLAMVLSGLGNMPAAKAHLVKALTVLSRQDPNGSTRIATCRSSLGLVLKELGELKEAKRNLSMALTYLETSDQAEKVAILAAKMNLGLVLVDSNELREAHSCFVEALAGFVKHCGEADPRAAKAHNNLGNVLHLLGDLERAEAHMRDALKIDLEALSDTHPNIAVRRSNLAMILLARNKTKEARREMEIALAMDLENLPSGHYLVALRHLNLAMVLQRDGDLRGALGHANRALKIDLEDQGPNGARVALDRSTLGEILIALGDAKGGDAHGAEAVRIARLLEDGSQMRRRIEQAWPHFGP